jgi:plastocyanin
MEQVQQVQVHIAAAKLGDARILFDDLEAHRRELRGLRGFVSMSINRATEAGGDTSASVETRWTDEAALNQYLGSSRTVESIVRDHADITVPDTLSVRALEGIDSAGPSKQSIVFERLSLALMVPLAIVAIGFAIIYSLSRIYLELGAGAGANTLAICVAGAILLVSWYFAENRNAPAWQFAVVGSTVAALLIGGTVWAQVSPGPDYHGFEDEHAEETPPPTPGELTIILADNVVQVEGEDNPTITVPSGMVVPVVNEGRALHNLQVSPFEAAICSSDDPSPCTDPARINAGDEGTITFDIPPGTYEYRCDFHTAEMFGTLEVGPPESDAPPAGATGTPGAAGTPAGDETPASDDTADTTGTPAASATPTLAP